MSKREHESACLIEVFTAEYSEVAELNSLKLRVLLFSVVQIFYLLSSHYCK